MANKTEVSAAWVSIVKNLPMKARVSLELKVVSRHFHDVFEHGVPE